jgi:hypothetical protein
MITLGEIQNKLEKNLFVDDNTNPVIANCIVREQTLKRNILRAFESITEHIERPNFEGELTFWQSDKIDRNINNLSNYIEILCAKLDRQKIINYCENHDFQKPFFIEQDDFIFIVNSFYGSVLLDILWASDISLSDVINISKGRIDHKNLEKKLPDKILEIKKTIIPYLQKNECYSEYTSLITESIKSYKCKIYKGSSLLILIVIEGLVRKLGKKLIVSQKIDDSYASKEYHSLNNFLRNVPWKDDYKIDKASLMFITGDYEFTDERKSSMNDEYVSINLKTRLDFLRRTFKEERDSILHGESHLFGETWDLYRNYSALYEVYLTIVYYEKLYENNR